MATTQNEESLLLALPMEMLDRIAVQFDYDYDAIFSTRLTCKTLEAATFDRFADKFFQSHEYCIFNKRSRLRLRELLTSSSRLTARMRCAVFTSSFFANKNHKHIKLALNQGETNMDAAQIAAMDTYSEYRADMLHNQRLPSAALIRSVLAAFKAKCPGAKFDLELSDNIRSSVRVHIDVIATVASLGIALDKLSLDVDSLGTRNSGNLLPGLLTCASSLTDFNFTNTNVDIAGAEAVDQLFARDRYSLLRSVVRSATSLRELALDFMRDDDMESLTHITSELVVANQNHMLRSLCLNALAINEVALLNALTGWAGQLEEIQFHAVVLSDVEGEGWSDVLRTFTLMPKLRNSRLFLLSEGIYLPGHRLVDLRHLEKGRKPEYFDTEKVEPKYLIWNNRANVVAGLQELLEVGLKYY